MSSAFVPPRFPSIAAVPSFQTMDQLHFLATGERLPPIAGDACPHPPEHYIRQTQQRQQRARAYTMLIQTARSSTMILSVKPGTVNGIPYNKILGIRGGIILFQGEQVVMTLWPDGYEHVEPTPPSSEASSPRRGFRLRTPPFQATMGPAGAVSPILGVGAAQAETLEEDDLPFRRILPGLSDYALAMKLKEWSGLMKDAQDNIDAIKTEMMKRETM